MRIRHLAATLLAALAVSAIDVRAQQAPSSSHERDVEAIRRAVIESGEAFNRRDPAGIMALYARDIVLVYPGIPDSDYADLERSFAQMTAGTPGVTVRTSPNIEEILVSGDLAVVRVTWTTTTTETTPARVSTHQMRDMQVWRWEADGSWKFARGMHFRDPPPTPPTPPAPPTPAPDAAGRRPGS